MKNDIKRLPIDPEEVTGTCNLSSWESIVVSFFFTVVTLAAILKDLN
jgi:hypothetical protein